MSQIEAIYIGEREAMIAEVAAWDPRQIGRSEAQCKYLVMPYGDAQWDTEYFSRKDEAKAYAKELAETYSVPVRWVG